MKDILKYIPGFRSNHKWKMIIALIYYLICITFLGAGIGMFLFSEAIPFVIFNAIKAFKFRKKEAVILAIIPFIVMCLGMGLVPKTDSLAARNKINAKANTTSANKKENNKKTASQAVKESSKPTAQSVTSDTSKNTATDSDKASVNGQMKVHYIDVGQGDSELIQNNGQNMLIDTGTNASTNSLISYLKAQGVNKIDYLILTHPHEDHIGGADAVIENFNIGTIYMPKVTENTKTFKDVVNAMNAKGLNASQPDAGTEFNLGQAKCTVLGPINVNSKDLNTYSIVIKVTFGNNKFLFTGDAQTSNENDMINKGFDLSADILKAGHHGSNTSTSDVFLNKVNPKYVVISCGKGNDYGHPHQETMQKLQTKGIQVYRTDEAGTIVATSDGNNINFNSKPGDYSNGGTHNTAAKNTSDSTQTQQAKTTTEAAASTSAQSETPANSDNERTVYYTPNGKSYHYDRNCPTLARSKIVLSGKLQDVIKKGKSDPCDKCVH